MGYAAVRRKRTGTSSSETMRKYKTQKFDHVGVKTLRSMRGRGVKPFYSQSALGLGTRKSHFLSSWRRLKGMGPQ